jgi:cyclophilin family peptidyl-prolyl cis-trans isomerase
MKYDRNLVVYLSIVAVAVMVLMFGCRSEKGNLRGLKMVKLETTKGIIVIEVNETAAPVTAANFLQYVNDGFYDGTIFHRVIPNFMIQGGGFTPDMKQKTTRPAIVNESKNGLKNKRGAIAMARLNDPNSATAQFFINHVDNAYLDKSGYAVFGQVVEGMDVVDAIAKVETGIKDMYEKVPIEPVIIKSAKVVSKK